MGKGYGGGGPAKNKRVRSRIGSTMPTSESSLMSRASRQIAFPFRKRKERLRMASTICTSPSPFESPRMKVPPAETGAEKQRTEQSARAIKANREIEGRDIAHLQSGKSRGFALGPWRRARVDNERLMLCEEPTEGEKEGCDAIAPVFHYERLPQVEVSTSSWVAMQLEAPRLRSLRSSTARATSDIVFPRARRERSRAST